MLVIGAGGLGCPAALYLAGAGVGRLGLVDRDGVDVSNLHRQIAHTEARVGVHKAESAAIACRALNSSIEVSPPPPSLSVPQLPHLSCLPQCCPSVTPAMSPAQHTLHVWAFAATYRGHGSIYVQHSVHCIIPWCYTCACSASAECSKVLGFQ